MRDLSHLADLPRDRIVKSVAVGGNRGAHGGVLLKFLMWNGRTEALFVIKAPAGALNRSLKQSQWIGRLPEISGAENDRLLSIMPTIEDYDWNAHHEAGRMVGETRLLSLTNAECVEFVLEDETLRAFAIPKNVARFLSDYLDEYQDLL